MDDVLHKVETQRVWLSDQILNASTEVINYGESVLINAATPETLAQITRASGLSTAAWVAIILAAAFVCLVCVLPALLCCTLKTAVSRVLGCILWTLTCGYCCTDCWLLKLCVGKDSDAERRRKRLGIPPNYPDDESDEL